MVEVVRVVFPALNPRAAVNIGSPECWSKDGHADSIDRWVADPLYTL
jgi:DNA polymerase-1